jgi:TRAP-type uncharacterized transport system substrate-binding protein
MLGQLASVLAGDGQQGVAVAGSLSSNFAIARFDALKSRPGDWRVVAPLNTEELYAIVRDDSPLRYLHELGGRRINVGAMGSPRGLSGAALYRQMFGAALPVTASTEDSLDVALRHLLDGTGVDALWIFDGQPSGWLANLPESTRRRLRLLRLAPEAAASRHALEAYLPARLASPLETDGATAVETLGVVTFLVASAGETGSAKLAQALCGHLPELRRDGHPKWREVRPGMQLPTGLPSALDAAQARRACVSSTAQFNSSTSKAGLRP